MKDGLDEIRLEVTERTADAIQRVDQNHVLTERVNEKLDAVLAMLESQSSEPGMRNYQISTPVQAPPGMEGQGLPGIMETHTPAQAQRSPHFENVDERPIPAIPVPRFWRGTQHNGAPSSPPMTSFVEEWWKWLPPARVAWYRRTDQYSKSEAADWILVGPWSPDHDESELQDLPEAEPEIVRL